MQPIFMLSADFPTLSAPSSPSCVVDVISPTTYCGPAPPRPKAPLSGADSPYQGEMSRRDKRGRELSARRTERLSQIRLNLSVSASPSHLPWKGRLCSVLICKIIRHYGNIDIYAKHSTLRYNNPPIPKEALALLRWFWYPETS